MEIVVEADDTGQKHDNDDIAKKESHGASKLGQASNFTCSSIQQKDARR